MSSAVSVSEITSPDEKKTISREILEALPDWFGIPEAREEYIANSAGEIFFAAMEGNEALGFLTLKRTGEATAELAVMGVRKEYHRRGIGKSLFAVAKARAADLGYSFLQVKTVQMGRYPEYDATNRFYLSLGFRELEVFPTLWDECNPCQIYIMHIGG
ncbi:MAG: GNAT family N-acetyltransferase [Oscillospiraceae bacterium]|nr:GNAT family N-acetyltransferase [Oscillospiraceae bacterium]